MANNYQYITQTGTILPDTGDLLTQIQTEYKNAFGNDLVVTSDTPQGVQIASETLARDAVINNNAALANQINPNLAGGIFLDAIWALTGGMRRASLNSTVSINYTGIPGTVVPATVILQNPTTGDLWTGTQTITLDVNGLGSALYQAAIAGPIAAPINSITQIVNGVLGLETVTNPAAATLGSLTESDETSRARRRVTLALQGLALPEAIISALNATANVKSLTFRENISGMTQVIDGITMVGHSIYACVDGGTDLDVATTLLAKKSAGAAYNGSTSVNVTEPASGQVYPVLFDRPTLIPVLARVTVKANSAITDPTNAVIQAILDFANGLIDGQAGFTVGATVSAFELAGAVSQEVPQLFVSLLEITKASLVNYSTSPIPIAINEKATIQASSIIVIIT